MKTNKSLIPFIEKFCAWLAILMPITISLGRGIADTNLSLISGLFLCHILLTRNYDFLKERWVQVALCLWGYLILNSLFRDSIVTSLLKVLPFIRFILFAICLQVIVSKTPNINKKIFTALIIAVGFLTIDGYIQLVLGKDIFGKQTILEHMGDYNYYRLTGPFSKKVLGSVITMLTPPIIALVLYQIHEKKKAAHLFVIPLILVCAIIFATGERAASIQIVFSIICITLFLCYRKKLNLKPLLYIPIILVAIYFVIPEDLLARHLSSFKVMKEGSKSVYFMLWKTGITLGLAYPFFGIGGNNYEVFCKQISGFCSYHPHNIYIEFFAEFGIVGLLLFCLLLYSLATLIIKSLLTNTNKNFIYILILGTAVALLQKILPLPSSGFFKNWYAVPLWFTIGWNLCLIETLKKDEKDTI